MKLIVTLILISILFITGCEENKHTITISDCSENIAVILSPDGSQVAFTRYFDYESDAIDFGTALLGYTTTPVYTGIFLYILDLSTMKLARIADIGDYKDYSYSGNLVEYSNISWESNLIAYNSFDKIYVINLDGACKSSVDTMTYYGRGIKLFTLSGDGRSVIYLTQVYYSMSERKNILHYVDVNENNKSFEVELPELPDIRDIIWDSGHNCILLDDYTRVWQINENGSIEFNANFDEFRRRRMGSADTSQPFGKLDELTKDISYKEWGVPPPDDFD